MDKKSVFKTIIADFIEKPLAEVMPRALKIPTNVPKIISLLGARRTGKTYILFGIIHELRRVQKPFVPMF